MLRVGSGRLEKELLVFWNTEFAKCGAGSGFVFIFCFCFGVLMAGGLW